MSDAQPQPPPMIPTKQSRESLYAHTFTTAVIVVFAGLGMLTGRLHFGYFVGLCVLCGGWVTPAVAGAVLMRFAESYGRALYAPPPGTLVPGTAPPEPPAAPTPARPSGETQTHQRAATGDDFPPPGLGGLAVVAAGAMPMFRALHGMSDATVGLSVFLSACVLLAAIANG